jgi:ABC-type transport system involved in cytochrome c biogenesis permease subunit
LRRAGLACLLAVVAILAPCPVWTPDVFTWWQVPVVIVILICYLGAALFDTLFFDRYP